MTAGKEKLLTRAFWEELAGSPVCGRYLLNDLIGSTETSGVYRTSVGVGSAALKLASADGGVGEVPRIEHPHIIRLFDSGNCEVGQKPLRYYVTEVADENLGAVVADRPLSPDETREMLGPVLEALAYLHDRGLAHGNIKPSNILAVGDSIKLAVDSIRPTGAVASPAEDMRALGLTLIEVLTQERQPSRIASIPQPFHDIVEHSLQSDPALRWTARQAAMRLTGVAPVAVPQAKEVPSPAKEAGLSPPAPKEGNNRFWIYAAVAVLFGAALIFSLSRGTGSSSGSSPSPPAVPAHQVAPPPRAQEKPIPPKPGPFEPQSMPVTASKRQPFVAQKATPAPAQKATPAPAPKGHGWFVVTASYGRQEDAAHEAAVLARQWPQFKPTVFPPSPIDTHYLVILGSGLSEDGAESLRQRAVASGLPGDTYIKKYPSRP